MPEPLYTGEKIPHYSEEKPEPRFLNHVVVVSGFYEGYQGYLTHKNEDGTYRVDITDSIPHNPHIVRLVKDLVVSADLERDCFRIV